MVGKLRRLCQFRRENLPSYLIPVLCHFLWVASSSSGFFKFFQLHFNNVDGIAFFTWFVRALSKNVAAPVGCSARYWLTCVIWTLAIMMSKLVGAFENKWSCATCYIMDLSRLKEQSSLSIRLDNKREKHLWD